MSDDELFEKLEELVKLSDPDSANFESAMEKRDELWNEVTKDIRDNLSHFLLMYTNILVDKGLIDRYSKEVFADRILSSIHYHVMDDLIKTFCPEINKEE
jgi:hypothetical protein